ncbi:MAG: DKNYY domain-containing protein [Flavobacteriales bacterium]|nr:DKNYY domain-containing protein [Flavobacteriales bacterium]
MKQSCSNNIITKLTFILLSLSLLTSCQEGYKKENDQWVWISYDEAVGKRVANVKSADLKTFKVLKNKNYAVDKNYVYYRTQKIKNSNPKTFSVLTDNGYSKDDKKVFLDWHEIVNANPKSFELLSFPYSKDDNDVFCGTLPLHLSKDEINEFRVINMSTARSTILLSHFIEQNPGFNWLDTLNIDGVIVNEIATAKTEKRNFKGYREIIIHNEKQ